VARFKIMLKELLNFGWMIWGEIKRSPKWGAFRNSLVKKYKTCAACGDRDDLEIHHKLPVSWNGSELDEENCICLCRNCHYFLGHFQDWTSYNKDIVRDAADYLARRSNRPQHFDNDQPPDHQPNS